MKLFATTGFGVEGILKNECTLLGYEIDAVDQGSVLFDGDLVEANIALRTADRVYIVLKKGRAVTFDELFDLVRSIEVDEYFPKDARVTIEAKSHKSVLFSLRDIQRIAKKAIATCFKERYKVLVMEETGNHYPITIRIEKDEVLVLLDTSGLPLHKRGYRESGKIAPIRETIAASLVLFSRYFGKGPFFDPMCGSGTIAIEAALIAENRPPGINRSFLFETWGIDSSDTRERLRAKIKEPSSEYFGSDMNPEAVRLAKRNAKRAGVQIHFEIKNLVNFETDLRGGTLVTNAPYGKRIGTDTELDEMEKALSERVLTLKTFRLGLLLGNPDFSRQYHSRYAKVRRLYNGNIQAYFYQYEPEERW
ncbi:THUMP domain-containing class I SAM-dependent RNA methyltransferase [Guggenheimella bovis]